MTKQFAVRSSNLVDFSLLLQKTRVCLRVLRFFSFPFFFTGIKNVALFFGAISAQSRKERRRKKKENEEEDGSDESDDNSLTSSQVAGAVSEEWISNYPSVIDEKLCPSINYWIALTTPNGAPANPLIIHRALLECGVETETQQVHTLYVYNAYPS